MIVAEALDTLHLLIIAGGVWVLIGAAALTLALAVLLVGLCAAVRALWRRVRPKSHPRPSWALRGRTARRYARTRPDYDEAA